MKHPENLDSARLKHLPLGPDLTSKLWGTVWMTLHPSRSI